MNKSLLNTKSVVPRQDVRAFEKKLFRFGFGYPLNLGLSTLPKFSKGAKENIAFAINFNGEITTFKYNDEYMEYEQRFEDEIKWEYFFD